MYTSSLHSRFACRLLHSSLRRSLPLAAPVSLSITSRLFLSSPPPTRSVYPSLYPSLILPLKAFSTLSSNSSSPNSNPDKQIPAESPSQPAHTATANPTVNPDATSKSTSDSSLASSPESVVDSVSSSDSASSTVSASDSANSESTSPSSSSSTSPAASASPPSTSISNIRGTWWFQLLRLDLSSLSAISSGFGYALAAGWISLAALPYIAACIVGPLFLSFSATIFNQMQEREHDRKMIRTRNRPLATQLPSKQIALWKAGAGATAFGVLGTVILYFGGSGSLIPPILGLSTMVLYNLVYTPMKRWTVYNTEFGAIVGAIPVLIGASCAWPMSFASLLAGSVPQNLAEVLTGFLFLLLWQIPHFMVISHTRQAEYLQAGFKMRSNYDLEPPKSFHIGSRAYAMIYGAGLLTLPFFSYLHGAGEFFLLSGTMWSMYHMKHIYRFWKTPKEYNTPKKRSFIYIYFTGMFICLILDNLMPLAHQVFYPAPTREKWQESVKNPHYCIYIVAKIQSRDLLHDPRKYFSENSPFE